MADTDGDGRFKKKNLVLALEQFLHHQLLHKGIQYDMCDKSKYQYTYTCICRYIYIHTHIHIYVYR